MVALGSFSVRCVALCYEDTGYLEEGQKSKGFKYTSNIQMVAFKSATPAWKRFEHVAFFKVLLQRGIVWNIVSPTLVILVLHFENR
jgi:hypothetical protein